jgi:hypothetical protein
MVVQDTLERCGITTIHSAHGFGKQPIERACRFHVERRLAEGRPQRESGVPAVVA